jgi:hypothetical protein
MSLRKLASLPEAFADRQLLSLEADKMAIKLFCNQPRDSRHLVEPWGIRRREVPLSRTRAQILPRVHGRDAGHLTVRPGSRQEALLPMMGLLRRSLAWAQSVRRKHRFTKNLDRSRSSLSHRCLPRSADQPCSIA